MSPSTTEHDQQRRLSPHPAILLWPLTVGPPLARQARRLLEATLTTLPIEAESLNDALLMINEVASNAEAYACPPYELRVFHTYRRTVVEFIDGDCTTLRMPSNAVPELMLSDIDSAEIEALERGRGLLTVVALSRGDCGVRQLTTASKQICTGKVIWFAVPQ